MLALIIGFLILTLLKHLIRWKPKWAMFFLWFRFCVVVKSSVALRRNRLLLAKCKLWMCLLWPCWELSTDLSKVQKMRYARKTKIKYSTLAVFSHVFNSYAYLWIATLILSFLCKCVAPSHVIPWVEADTHTSEQLESTIQNRWIYIERFL